MKLPAADLISQDVLRRVGKSRHTLRPILHKVMVLVAIESLNFIVLVVRHCLWRDYRRYQVFD